MAKVKTAVEKITAFLKAKGYDTTEIKDAFAELDAADADLGTIASQLTETKTKNTEWVNWYNQVVPEVQSAMAQRDAYKAKLDKLEAAGIKVSDEQKQAAEVKVPGETGQYVSPDELKRFKSDLASASSSVMKQMVGLSFKHFKKFKAEPDWDAIEKLMSEGKAGNIEEGYRKWSKPMREERRIKKQEKEVNSKIKQGVQDTLSKQGVVMTRKRGDEVEQDLLGKAAAQKNYKDMTPEEKRTYDNDLKAGFVSDINSEITH